MHTSRYISPLNTYGLPLVYQLLYSSYIRGSKFSRIAVLKEFVENNSRMRVAHACDSAGAQSLAELISQTILNSRNLRN